MEFIPAKKIISGYQKEGWYTSNYNMNIYKGCSHGCIYCDSRSECYQIRDFDRVRAKENALETIERDLASKRKKGIVHTGAMSDHYNPMEAEYELTRGALKLLDKYRFGLALTTKSDLVLRDIDVLERIASHSPVYINFTVTTADDQLCRKIERAVCPSSARIKALKLLHEHNIRGGVALMPVLPYINDTKENIRGVVELAASAGADWIFCYGGFGVTLRGNQREHYYKWLDQEFPGVKQKYIQTYRNEYSCSSPRHPALWKYFRQLCSQYNLLYAMSDINEMLKAKRKNEYEQLSLFDQLE